MKVLTDSFCLKKMPGGALSCARGRKAQTSIEYLMLLAGVLVLVVLLVVLLRGTIFAPNEAKIINQSDEIRGWIASLQPTGTAGASGTDYGDLAGMPGGPAQ